jgi:hypothetical protein
MKVFAAFACLALGFSASATAQQPRAFRCDAPQGKVVNYGDWPRSDGTFLQRFADGPKWSDDGFNGISPIVVVSGDQMAITWGNYVPSLLDRKVDDRPRIFHVPIQGRDHVSVYGTVIMPSVVHVFRFYFNQLTLYRLTSSVYLMKEAPSEAAIYIARCRPI